MKHMKSLSMGTHSARRTQLAVKLRALLPASSAEYADIIPAKRQSRMYDGQNARETSVKTLAVATTEFVTLSRCLIVGANALQLRDEIRLRLLLMRLLFG